MRITTSQIMRNYQSSLMSNLGGLSAKRNAILSGKKITNASQDPSTAMVASNLERRLIRTQSYINSIDEVQARQDEQENAVMQIINACTDIGENFSTSAMNDPTGPDGRITYAKNLRALRDEIVSSLNAQYSDEFVFGGKAGMEVPFTINGDGKLCYRDIPVSRPYELMPKKSDKEYADKMIEWEKQKADVDADYQKYMDRLQELADEKVYMDLGFGLDFTERAGSSDANGNPYRDEVISSSAFNISIPGINIVGFDMDQDPDNQDLPNNVVDLISMMADQLDKGEDFDRETYGRLWMKFKDRAKDIDDFASTLGTRTNLLDATKTRMTDSELSLQTEIDNLVNADPAEAIMEYSWADYTYNAALKVGTNILSNSLLDFLK